MKPKFMIVIAEHEGGDTIGRLPLQEETREEVMEWAEEHLGNFDGKYVYFCEIFESGIWKDEKKKEDKKWWNRPRNMNCRLPSQCHCRDCLDMDKEE